MKSKLFIILLSALISGCVTVGDAVVSNSMKGLEIKKPSSICIQMPSDGVFEGIKQKGSGEKVGEIVMSSIPKGISTVTVLKESECKNAYILKSEILKYEDRLSGWSGKPDIIEVRVSLLSVEGGKLNTFTYYADSNMLVSAFFEWGNSPPYKLLGGEFKNKVSGLFAK
jgi:hypothetical protein